MAYMALYRKWRPKTFSEVVGQKQVSDTLARAIQENKVAHAYLFSGPRGTGKTSMAKIFARSINCIEGPTPHPCNICGPCKKILQGDFMDVIEIDAASNRGIDEVRALRENVKFLPVEGRKKVFIIDEAHMLTTEAWNALLKTIEEPPAHVMFIFATTEVDKLPVTIVSRCQRFSFRRISIEDMIQHLLYVAKESNLSLTPAGAQIIAIQAEGGLRDALSILDQCSGMTTDAITPSVVEELLGLVGKEEVLDIFDSLCRNEGVYILERIKKALEEGREPLQFVHALSEHLRALVLEKVVPSAEELRIYEGYRERLKEQAANISMKQLQKLMYDISRIEEHARRTSNPRIFVEMGLLSLAAGVEETIVTTTSGDALRIEQLVGRIAKLEAERQVLPNQQSVSRQGDVSARAPKPSSSSVTSSGGNSPKIATTTKIERVVVGTNKQYETIRREVLRWFEKQGMNFLIMPLKVAQLIYVDAVKVVLAFDTLFGLKVAQQERFHEGLVRAFSSVLGYSVEVETYLSNASELEPYITMKLGASSEVTVNTDVAKEEQKAEQRIEKQHAEKEESGSSLEGPKGILNGENLPPITSFEEELSMIAPYQEEGDSVMSQQEELPEDVKKWEPLQMTSEERNHPQLGKMLSAVSKNYDIYVEDLEEKNV